MELKEIVAQYATKCEKGVELNLADLTGDERFRTQIVEATVDYIKKYPKGCVVFQSYSSHRQTPLGKIINELALALPLITLVTGDVANLEKLYTPVQQVILIKQSFREGNCLKEQIAYLKEKGYDVKVLCLMSHSKDALQTFASDNEVEAEALFYTDEL